MHNRHVLNLVAKICIVIAPGLYGASPARSAVFTDDTFFAAQDRSIWSSGTGFTFDTGQRFLGTTWDVGKTIGGIKNVCVLFACADFGAEVGARTDGKLGIDYSLKVNSGSFDVQLPGRATFTTPDSYSGSTIGPITVGSSFTTLAAGLQVPISAGGPAVVRLPSLQVTGPTAQASLGLEARVDAFAGAKACFVVCYGPAIGPLGFDKSQSIATVNLNNDHQITVLDQTVSAHQSVSAFGGLLSASFDIPNLDSSSAATPNGFSGGVLTSTKRDGIAAVRANIAQIAADAVGFPFPLAGNLGPFGYNLIQTDSGLALDVQQSISLIPKVTGSYLFSSNVVPVVNGVAGAATNRIDFNFGDDVTFLPGQVASLSYLPVINVDGIVHNETDLVVSGNLDVKALGVDIAGLHLGPLIDTTLASDDLGRISLFDDVFTQHIGSIKTAPISFDFAGCSVNVKISEVSSRGVLCASSEYTTSGPYKDPDGTSHDNVDTNFCYQEGIIALSRCYSLYNVDQTSSFIDNGSRRQPTYVSSPTALSYKSIEIAPSTTDADQLVLLAALGYTGLPLGAASTFIVPQGASFDAIVSEPPALPIFLLGGIVAVRLARRRQARPNICRADLFRTRGVLL